MQKQTSNILFPYYYTYIPIYYKSIEYINFKYLNFSLI